MSFQAMTWAVEQRLPASQKLVLLMLANCCNHHTGRCTPKIKTLAEECGMAETTVKVALKALAEAGLITIIPRFLEGVQLPNSYALNLVMGGSESRGGGSASDPGWVGIRPRVGRQTPTEPGIEPGIEPIPHTPVGGDEEFEDPKPSRPVVDEVAVRKAAGRQPGNPGLTLADWLARCKADGVSPIPRDAAVWTEANECGIPEEFIRLAWQEFKDYWSNAAKTKRKKDWPSTFLNAVKGNRSRLWRSPSLRNYVLTNEGMQAQARQQFREQESQGAAT